jgi:gas vesicle protein
MSDVNRDRTPEEIRAELRQTRGEMDQTLDQLEYKVSPSRIRERQQRRWNDRWQRTREAVMGRVQSDSDGPSTSDRVQQAGDSVREAPDQALEQTRGNPLAAGLIAFGAGALLGSLLPPSEPEQEAAQTLRDRYEEDARQQAQRVAQEAKQELQPAAQQAAEDVKQTAQDAAQTTKQDAQQSAEQVRQEGERSRDRVQQS